MALFGGNKETKEEKTARKQQEMLDKYRLGDISDPDDIQSVQKIVMELTGTGILEFGATLAPNVNTNSQIQTYYQRAILEQNFIIIRQLDRISKLLSKE